MVRVFNYFDVFQGFIKFVDGGFGFFETVLGGAEFGLDFFHLIAIDFDAVF